MDSSSHFRFRHLIRPEDSSSVTNLGVLFLQMKLRSFNSLQHEDLSSLTFKSAALPREWRVTVLSSLDPGTFCSPLGSRKV